MTKENHNSRLKSMNGHYIDIILDIFSAVKLTADFTIELRKINAISTIKIMGIITNRHIPQTGFQ